MILESVLGGLLGAVTRLAPEVLDFLDRKNLRKHELMLGDQAYRTMQLQVTSARDLKNLDVEQSQFVTSMETLKAAIASQNTKTGIAWIDAISAMVRPAITMWVFVLYSLVKVAALSVALETKALSEAVLAVWGPEDASMLSAIIMFWFVGRVWDKQPPRS